MKLSRILEDPPLVLAPAVMLLSLARTTWIVSRKLLAPKVTVQYPEEKVAAAPRWRGRIVLTRDPDGQERCVACYLCSIACPVGCINLQAALGVNGRRRPSHFRINFSRCIFCGLCEEACPTYSIQLTPDFELGEYRRQDLVYELEDLLIDGPGKYHDYNFYRVAGVDIGVKGKGEGENEEPPADVRRLLP